MLQSIEARESGVHSHFHSQRGVALVVAMISLVVVTGLATLMLGAVDSERKGVVLDGDRLQATKFAEGALEIAEQTFLSDLASFQPLPTPPASSPYQVLSGTFTTGAHSLAWVVSRSTSTDAVGTVTAIGPSNRIDALTGLQMTIEPYILSTSVTIGTSSIRMRRHIEVQKTPIFQFLAYYAGDLEIQPGPAMTMNGRIHTNSDLYMNAGASLAINSSYVRTANNFHRHRKDPSPTSNGWIKMKDAQGGGLVTLPSQSDLAGLGISSPYGVDSDFMGWDFNGNGIADEPGEMPPFKNEAMDLFHGTLQTGEHGVHALQNPEIAAIQAYVPEAGGDFVQTTPGHYAAVAPGSGTHAKSYFHANADLVVIDDHVFNHAGVDITGLMPAGFLQTRNVWDQRENRSVPCTQINVGRLGDMDGNPATYDPCPYYPHNGLLFAARSGAAPGQSEGIVLTNGAELNVPSKWNAANYGAGLLGTGSTVGSPLGAAPPLGAVSFGNAEAMGLTVVSPAPVYVHGDYNTVSKKPAAVISDTINLLSKAWDFTKTSGQSKTAADTTYNLAMIMGHRPTNGAQYSGGFENLPRFHEDWSGKTCTLLGSFVSTWFSAIATGNWVYGGAWYSAPNRNWSYDTGFDQGRLPPFTPMAITDRQVAWEVIN